MPIIPFGTGTSLEGQVNAPFGGISLDLSHMNRILTVHAEDFDCVVEPGVTRKALNEHLREEGLFFSIDPGADASLGGMAATRASGTNAVRYGTMRDNVLNLTAVMADGTLLKTGNRARKSASGYDLTRLLVGSEGTLGIITELTLKLHGIPETILSAVCPFATIEGVCNATIAAMQIGLPLARIELADAVQIRACNAYSHLAIAEAPTLFLEFHGTASSTREQVEAFAEIARNEGGGEFRWAERPEERTKLWQARHDVYWAVMGLRPGVYITMQDLLYGLMLPSGNDAALEIAKNVDGSVEAFVARMNEKAEQLGLRDTHFTNPHGLDSRRHYSSAYDLAMLGRYAMGNEAFRAIAATQYYHLAPPSDYTLHNGNSLLASYAGAEGIKIGWTDEAGWTFVASAVREGRRVIVAVLNSDDRDGDAAALLDWAYASHDWAVISPQTARTLQLARRIGETTPLERYLRVCG